MAKVFVLTKFQIALNKAIISALNVNQVFKLKLTIEDVV